MNKLWGDNEIPHFSAGYGDFIPEIHEYVVDDSDGAVVVCAGGGYGMRAEHEGSEIAKWLNSNGVSAFVVDYRVSPYSHPSPISDAMRAIRYVRYNAKKFGIDENKIAIMGFSAGAHLAGTASVHYNKTFYQPVDEIDCVSPKPNATILCYPVIDMLEYRHDGSRQNLLCENPCHADKEFMSLYMHVTKDTPPAFLWHTSSDAAVPVENSILYATALSRVQVPFEMHIYPFGRHGLGLAKENPHVAQWADSCLNWLKLMGFKR